MSSFYDFGGYATVQEQQPSKLVCKWCLKDTHTNLYWNERERRWDTEIDGAKTFDNPGEAKQWARTRGMVITVWPTYV